MSGDHKKYAATGKPTGYAMGGGVGKKVKPKEIVSTVAKVLKGAVGAAGMPPSVPTGGPPSPMPTPQMPPLGGGMKRGGRAGKKKC